MRIQQIPIGQRPRQGDEPIPPRSRRRGVGPAEVVVVIVIVGILALLLMVGLTRSREVARQATCSRNLQQIGIALELYEQSTRRLPALPPLDGDDVQGGAPLALLLQQFGVVELGEIDPRAPAPKGPPSADVPEGRYVPGFVCPADPIATSRVFPAPVSYRANAGDRAEGSRGPFAPGESVTFAEVEAGHGAAYTAAFAERLVGSSGAANQPDRDYRVVPGPVPDAGCPEAPGAPLRTDAGRSWRELGWRSTLYTHAAPPGAARSCIAEDGRSAFMGASSGHVDGVRVLLMDGGVRTYTRSVAPAVWASLGSFRDEAGADLATPPGDDADDRPAPPRP